MLNYLKSPNNVLIKKSMGQWGRDDYKLRVLKLLRLSEITNEI